MFDLYPPSALPAVNHPDVQSIMDPTGDQARAIDPLLSLMHWVCGFMFVLVIAALALVFWRSWIARRRGHAHASLSERALRIGLRVWLALVVVGLVVLTTASFLVDRTLLDGGDAALDIRITAKQWWWQIEYRGADPSQNFMTANELHLPLARKARIQLRSADVIHSFWVPNLAGKRDMIPGHVNTIELTPRRLGILRGTCAEFCGLQHANMALVVVVENDAEFAAWRARQLQPAATPQDETQQRGARLFISSACVMCHAIRGTTAASQAGPDLTHLASRRMLAAGARPLTPGSLAAWLADPQAQKPGANMPAVALEPDQLDALIAYLLALK